MILFTKPACKKCDYIKQAVDLDRLGVQVMDVTTIEGLASLAWHELVATSQVTLPILVKDDGDVVTGVINIKNYLLGIRND
jgi:glutaredoxin